VRVTLADAGTPDGARYYDRQTGKRLENLPFCPDVAWEHFADGLYPARLSSTGNGGSLTKPRGKMGYIDRLGNWVIPPQFKVGLQHGHYFRDGRAVVSVDRGMGVIDEVGRWVVKPGTYHYLFGYMEGLCLFHELKGKLGFLGLDGRVAITPRYKSARFFSDGLCLVEDEKGWHCIDRLGDTRFRLAGRPLGSQFSDGLLLVDQSALTGKGEGISDGPPGKCGYLGTDGEIAIPLQFDLGRDFSEGLAVVGSWRSAIAGPNETSGVFETKEGERFEYTVYGAIDVKGRVVIPLVYDGLSLFRDGLAAFRRGGGKWGYLDRHGREVIPARFDRARPFFDGLAEVAIDGKVALIDVSGRVVVDTGVEWIEF